jgi:hypothetical protein
MKRGSPAKAQRRKEEGTRFLLGFTLRLCAFAGENA